MAKSKLTRFDSAEELARATASLWLDEVAAAARLSQLHHVALSGGRITLKFFAATIELAQARRLLLGDVHFFWADERCLPPDDAESNFAAANQLFFQPLGIAADQIHRIRGEESPTRAAELATEEILRIVPGAPTSAPALGMHRSKAGGDAGAPVYGKGGGVGRQPVLDLIFLGMGEDGHVASLFPGEPESVRADPAVYRAIANSPKPPPNRVTLGYPAIAAAREVWVLASGAGKEAALRESLRPDSQTPLARVLQSRERTRVFTDLAVE
jgi:6-phosphogluconolactonase